MNFKNASQLKLLALAISSLMATTLSGTANAQNYEQEMVIVHPFQWTYNNIAKECTEYLGPAGFDGIQISNPAEHVNRNDVWWAIYQPVNFNSLNTMEGTEEDLKNMINACNKAGVKVFVDAVLNQRASGTGTGIAGSYYSESNYPDGFTPADFHYGCAINTYTDANQVRYCALSGMPDTATDQDSTQNKIASFLAKLMNMGVYGFRIDAAKHMGYTDVERILAKTANLTGRRPPAYLEVIGAFGEAADIQPDKYQYIENAAVTDFGYSNQIDKAFGQGDYGTAFDLGTYFSHENAEVFVNNHDNEWGRCSAGTCSMLTQNNANYHLAQSWMAVWPVGKVRQVYSGYAFPINYDNPGRVSDYAHDVGGPLGADRCEGGWLCQHRVPFVLNAPRFARATRGQEPTSQGFDDGILWFNRGAKGFYAMNTTDHSVTHTFKVEVPDNEYCDILGTSDPKTTPCGQDVNVTGGMLTLTIPAKSAQAICTDEEWCGVKDVCEIDPNGASCLCKTAGQNKDSYGVCKSYCDANPSDEKCFCQQNPDSDECAIPPTRPELCYAGTSNAWKFDKMTYSGKTGLWSIDVSLDGSANQRFKVSENCAWAGNVYGSSGIEGKLALNNSTTGDVYTSLKGEYVLNIKDADMTYSFTEKSSVNHAPVAAFSHSADKLSVSFTNASTDADNDALSYSWDFGNGTSSTEKNPAVSYTKAGTYTVTLTVTDAKGAKSEKSVQVTVSDGGNNFTQTKGNLCYAGTSNDWTFSKMTFDKSTGYWTLNVTLNGSSTQRFKVVDGCSWSGSTIYGSSGTKGKLAVNTSTNGDEYTTLKGNYVLMVKDSNMTYVLQAK